MVRKQILPEQLLRYFSMKTFVHLKVSVAVKLLIRFSILPPMPYVYNFNIKPSCQTLSKAFKMSKNTLTSNDELKSKPLYIS